VERTFIWRLVGKIQITTEQWPCQGTNTVDKNPELYLLQREEMGGNHMRYKIIRKLGGCILMIALGGLLGSAKLGVWPAGLINSPSRMTKVVLTPKSGMGGSDN